MTNLLDFLILGFATYRLSSLLVEERGPYDILGKLRYWIGIRYDAQSIPYSTNHKGFWYEGSQLFLCMWCMSVWIGAAMVVLYAIWPDLIVWLMLPFALSAFALWIQGRVE